MLCLLLVDICTLDFDKCTRKKQPFLAAEKLRF